jgi:hypothetical protein
MAKRYTVSDGKLVLYLFPAEEGGFNVTSPLDPALITQAETLEEAFVMAYDAQKCLRLARAKLARKRDELSLDTGNPLSRSTRNPASASRARVTSPLQGSHRGSRSRKVHNQ